MKEGFRSAERVEVDQPCVVSGPGFRLKDATLVNIGLGGGLVACGAELPIGQEVEVTIERAPVGALKGRVVRCSAVGGSWRVALRWELDDPERTAELAGWLGSLPRVGTFGGE